MNKSDVEKYAVHERTMRVEGLEKVGELGWPHEALSTYRHDLNFRITLKKDDLQLQDTKGKMNDTKNQQFKAKLC